VNTLKYAFYNEHLSSKERFEQSAKEYIMQTELYMTCIAHFYQYICYVFRVWLANSDVSCSCKLLLYSSLNCWI
jgi:hypothetical protein